MEMLDVIMAEVNTYGHVDNPAIDTETERLADRVLETLESMSTLLQHIGKFVGTPFSTSGVTPLKRP